jgi:elongation factor 1-beta
VQLFDAVAKAPDASAYPNVARFYSHIASFAADVRAQWPAAFGASGGKGAAKGAAAPAKAAAAPPKAAAPAPAAEEEDDADLFGDDGDAAAAAAAAKVSKVRQLFDDHLAPLQPPFAPLCFFHPSLLASVLQPAAEEKKEKKVEISKTAVIYDVKPIEAGQDMKAMEDAIRGIVMDGLIWGEEFKVIDVAYGIQKLVVQAVVEDEKVGLQDIEDKFEELSDIIQSFDMVRLRLRSSVSTDKSGTFRRCPSLHCVQLNMNKVAGR